MADYTPTTVVQVQWDGSTWSTVPVQDLSVSHGASPTGNPDRPTILPAYGQLTVRGALTTAMRAGQRFGCRIRIGGSTRWQGWVQEPQVSPGPVPLVSWLLAGKQQNTIQTDAVVNRPAGTIAAWITALGASAANVPSRNLKAVNHDSRQGEILSLLAAVASASVLERADGSVRFAGYALGSSPSGAVVLASDQMRVRIPESAARADRIRNQATVIRTGSTDTTERSFRQTSALAATGSTRGAQQSLIMRATVTLPTETGVTWRDVKSRLRRAQATVIGRTRGNRSGSLQVYDPGGIGETQQVDIPSAALPTVAHTVNGASVALTATYAPGAPANESIPYTYSGDRRQLDFEPVPWTGWGASPGNQTTVFWAPASDPVFPPPQPGDAPRSFSRGSAGNPVGLPLFGFNIEFEVTATRDASQPDRDIVVQDARSIGLWGLRPLVLPDWLTGNTDLSAQLADIARLRHEHVVTFSGRQASQTLHNRVFGVDAGDYAALDLVDTARNISIKQYCLVTQRTLQWSAISGLQVTLRCLEVGQPYNP